MLGGRSRRRPVRSRRRRRSRRRSAAHARCLAGLSGPPSSSPTSSPEPEQRGLDALKQKAPESPQNARASRFLFLANDGSTRFYRDAEVLLTRYAQRLLICRIDLAGEAFGAAILGAPRLVRAVLVHDKKLGARALLALLPSWSRSELTARLERTLLPIATARGREAETPSSVKPAAPSCLSGLPEPRASRSYQSAASRRGAPTSVLRRRSRSRPRPRLAGGVNPSRGGGADEHASRRCGHRGLPLGGVATFLQKHA